MNKDPKKQGPKKKGPQGNQKTDKAGTGDNDSRFAPERHETDETLQEQPVVNEEKQKKIVNEQSDLKGEHLPDSKKTVPDKDGDIGEKIPAMD